MEEKFHADFSVEVNKAIFRVNAARVADGYYIVMRLISSNPPNMEDLKFFPQTEQAIRAIADQDSGLFLVCGPTGSGKTTTIASIIKYINKNSYGNIISLEDPIEYKHKSINSHVLQRELGRDFPNFKVALEALLREDPDVAYIGEIRDEETLNLALQVAETGHLVLATIHADSPVESIQRMVGMSSNSNLIRDRLKSSLRGVLAQKLKPYKDPNDVNEKGEPRKKRILMWEMLTVNQGAKNLIKEGNERAVNGLLDNTSGCISYNKVLMEYCKQNILSFETALKFSTDKESFTSTYCRANE
jgi:twitching motility protein PilT